MENSVFAKEERFIQDIEVILKNKNLNENVEVFETLLKEYKKINKRFHKIVTMSDKQQEEVNKKNQTLKELSVTLSKYLSPQIYQSIFMGKHDGSLKSSRKKLSIFFSDIVNFTGTTETMAPEELTKFLNHYLDEMFSIALKHGATIDKFIGDAILIFFGDPESKGDKADAIACASMAIEMRERMEALSKIWMNAGLKEPFKVRIGISTGYVTVGNFGSSHRMDYTIIGGQVNLASRLQSNSNINEILISYDTYALIKDKIFCEEKGSILVKGIPYPILTYQVINHFDKIKQKDEITKVGDGFSFYLNKDKIKKEEILRALNDIKEDLENS